MTVAERGVMVDSASGHATAVQNWARAVWHAGGQHKKAPGLVARAHRYVTAHGFAVAAIDAAGQATGRGPRRTSSSRRAFGSEWRQPNHRPGDHAPQHPTLGAGRPEWQATLDALQDRDCVGGGGSVGFWGVSLGSVVGVPLVAAEPRISAAVFGLAGHETLATAAARDI
jgi:hypothetical protein